ncbi:MAG: phage terminase large subunit [Eubacteriales bacterium]
MCISVEEIKTEIRRRNFWEFCVYMDPGFFTLAKWHLKLIAKYLQKLADQEINKLIISEPPRAGKSYEVSLFHAWMIGRFPEESSMRNSYAAELAEKFSYNIREFIQKEKYKKVFSDIELKKDRRSVSDWSITLAKDASYFCAGVGGPITGKGCKKVGTLDDSLKNIEDALSETVLEKTWQWYTSTHLSRFETGCANLHVATRWSRKDPIGRILEDKAGVYVEDYVEQYDDWYVITIPALINGESFCEEIKTTEEYLEIKKITDDFIWEAEYMQHPIEAKGLLYPVEQLNRFTIADLSTKKPDGIVGFTDTADKGSDYLCSLIGKRFGDYTYITNAIYTQDGVEITEPLVSQMIIDTKADVMTIEANNGGSSYARNVRKLVRPKWKCSIADEHQTTNKETRILMNAGYVKEYFYFRSDYEPGSDYDKYMRALTSYVKLGRNKNDDSPDCTTGLAEKMKYRTFGQPQPKNRDDFADREPKPESIAGTKIDKSYMNYGS